MKLLGESNCLVFNELTEEEVYSYFEKFGEQYWNDTDNHICIPARELSEDQISKYNMFFGTDLSRVEFLIVLLDKVLLDAPAEETDKKEN